MSVLFPEEVVEMAAEWLAQHQWQPGDDDLKVPRHMIQGYRRRRLTGVLREVADKAISKDKHAIGVTVDCRPAKGIEVPRATIYIMEGIASGYLNDETKPSFFWPPQAV
jgi:hypothetical protein